MLVGGVIVSLIFLLGNYDLAQIWSIAGASDLGGATQAGHTQFFDFSLDTHAPFVIWAILLGRPIWVFFDYGLNQIVVQRYFSARSLKDCMRSMLLQPLLGLPIVLSLYFIGLGLVAHYHENPELLQSLLSLSADKERGHAKSLPPFHRKLPAGGDKGAGDRRNIRRNHVQPGFGYQFHRRGLRRGLLPAVFGKPQRRRKNMI